MRVVEAYARPIDCSSKEAGINLLRKVEWCARLSHRSEARQTAVSWEKFLTSIVLHHGDWSVTEHASITVDVRVDVKTATAWTRHRIGAYTQESTRFVNYTREGFDIEVIAPESLKSPARFWEYVQWLDAMQGAEDAYGKLVKSGVAPEEARGVLPHNQATRLAVTYNLRNWRHFFLMRTTKEAHPLMRQVATQLLEQFKHLVPLLYDDIVPEARQINNLSKPQ